VIFVCSLHTLREKGVPFLFTDSHASLETTQFSSDLAMLNRIDWSLLQRRDFRHDPEDPGKKERYQAEALVYRHLPINAVLGVLCHNDQVATEVQEEASACGHSLQVVAKPRWYV